MGKALLFYFLTFALSAKVILKYGTLAPEGSPWGLAVKKLQKEIEAKSGGELSLRVFYSGLSGDEKAMMEKLRRGILDMASFTGIELGQVVGDVRILELPFFFENEKQVDAVTSALLPDFEKKFLEKGFLVLAWGESGFVYLFTKKPVRTVEDMKGVKIWAPKGDELVKAMLMEFGLVPVYLGFESVLPQLETGGLEAVYGPPMGVIGLQWFRSVKYYSRVKLAHGTGATLMNAQSYQKLPENLQKILRESWKSHSRQLVETLRKENEKAFITLQNQGIVAVDVPESELQKLQSQAKKVEASLAGKLYSQELLNKARSVRDRAK